MTKRFTESFKLQAVEKALTRTEGTTLEEITERLGIGRSTLTRWILGSGKQPLKGTTHPSMKKETRPQDLSLKERLAHVINCSALDTSEISQYCRESGIYAHHIQQWKLDFENGNTAQMPSKKSTETKSLKTEITTLKKELHRKDKALAETAALLVLQKKVHEIWGNDEDNSQ